MKLLKDLLVKSDEGNYTKVAKVIIDFLKKNEKFVGRLAMLSSFGFICNELVTGNPTVSF